MLRVIPTAVADFCSCAIDMHIPSYIIVNFYVHNLLKCGIYVLLLMFTYFHLDVYLQVQKNVLVRLFIQITVKQYYSILNRTQNH